jgi:glycosyltransferase involved in cell wall biosynthesis
MQVLHIISSPAAGGAEVYVKDLVKSLAQFGIRAHVGFLEHAADTGRSTEYEAGFLKELEDFDIPYFFIGHDARKKPWLGAFRVRKYIKRHDIAIYHSHLPFGVVYGIGLGVPRVYTHHSIEPRLNRFSFTLMNHLVDQYVGISAVCSEALERYTGRPVVTILNAVDKRKLVQRLRKHPGAKTFQALAIGRITAQKDYYFLVDSIKTLPPRLSNRLRVFVAGEGESQYTETLKQYVHDCGLGSTVSFLGNRLDIIDIIDGSDAFFMSSAWEGLPISLIEATVSGLPCVVTDVGGCKEIIDICKNGTLVAYGDKKAYADALISLMSDAELYNHFARNAIEYSAGLDVKRAAADHSKIYKTATRDII